jgi:hypothetical protein
MFSCSLRCGNESTSHHGSLKTEKKTAVNNNGSLKKREENHESSVCLLERFFNRWERRIELKGGE